MLFWFFLIFHQHYPVNKPIAYWFTVAVIGLKTKVKSKIIKTYRVVNMFFFFMIFRTLEGTKFNLLLSNSSFK